jgi:hypothetical protein
MTQDQFFKHYCATDSEQATMLKLKDFPPDDNFSKRLGRHNEVCAIPSHLLHDYMWCDST